MTILSSSISAILQALNKAPHMTWLPRAGMLATISNASSINLARLSKFIIQPKCLTQGSIPYLLHINPKCIFLSSTNLECVRPQRSVIKVTLFGCTITHCISSNIYKALISSLCNNDSWGIEFQTWTVLALLGIKPNIIMASSRLPHLQYMSTSTVARKGVVSILVLLTCAGLTDRGQAHKERNRQWERSMAAESSGDERRHQW